MHGPSSKYKTQIKNLHSINHISLHTKYHWRTISSLLLSGSTNGKKILGTGIPYCNMLAFQSSSDWQSFITSLEVAIYLFWVAHLL